MLVPNQPSLWSILKPLFILHLDHITQYKHSHTSLQPYRPTATKLVWLSNHCFAFNFAFYIQSNTLQRNKTNITNIKQHSTWLRNTFLFVGSAGTLTLIATLMELLTLAASSISLSWMMGDRCLPEPRILSQLVQLTAMGL